jgi:hypothetical protein
MPAADFAANFCNFPQAWTVSKGKGVRVGIVGGRPDAARRITALAPEAEAAAVEPADYLGGSGGPWQVLLIAIPFVESDCEGALQAITALSRAGTAVVLPAWFGPMPEGAANPAWVAFLRRASEAGAIVAGTQGRAYQLGDAGFWKALPIDVYALHARVGAERYFEAGTAIRENLDELARLAAAAAALLKSARPELDAAGLKRGFCENGRRVARVDVEFGAGRLLFPALPRAPEASVRARLGSGARVHGIPEAVTLDAGLLLGLKPMGDGEWSQSALNAAAARRMATGKGITVAILDHLFDRENPALKGRMVEPGSVIEGAPVFSSAGHGTWMAADLLAVAPDVKIMPVRIVAPGRIGEAELYAKGIEYAVEHGADAISFSHQPAPKDKLAVVDAAVDKATARGVTFVYIHYRGAREEVVVPGPIEFASLDRGRKLAYVIGTNFVNEASFPYTWGLSQTAPMVAGVVAMMKEANQKLEPAEIKEILLRSGDPLLDAVKAVEAARALRGTSTRAPRP